MEKVLGLREASSGEGESEQETRELKRNEAASDSGESHEDNKMGVRNDREAPGWSVGPL